MKKFAYAAVVAVMACLASPVMAAKPNEVAACEKLLTPASVMKVTKQEVKAAPARRLKMAEMTKLKHGTTDISVQAVLGVTNATIQSSFEVVRSGLELSNGVTCFIPSIEVDVGFAEMDVAIASEIKPDSCTYNQVYLHELEHVALYRNHLPEIALELQTALKAKFGKIVYTTDEEAASEAMLNSVQLFVEEFLTAELVEHRSHHHEFDTDEQQAFLQGPCKSEIQAILKDALNRAL